MPSEKARKVAEQNIKQIDSLIALIKKQIPKPVEKPKDNDFFTVKEVD